MWATGPPKNKNNGKGKVKSPTQAKRRLEWATRHVWSIGELVGVLDAAEKTA
jgi:hypothetical protein